MSETIRYLFVYGTLMTAANDALGAEQRDRLQRESRSLGPATMSGARLYDLGSYPGLKESGNPGDVVHGEVIELLTPQSTLPWLDDYEGAGSGAQSRNEYARVERVVRLASGVELTAWIYVICRDDVRGPPIAAGRWTAADQSSSA